MVEILVTEAAVTIGIRAPLPGAMANMNRGGAPAPTTTTTTFPTSPTATHASVIAGSNTASNTVTEKEPTKAELQAQLASLAATLADLSVLFQAVLAKTGTPANSRPPQAVVPHTTSAAPPSAPSAVATPNATPALPASKQAAQAKKHLQPRRMKWKKDGKTKTGFAGRMGNRISGPRLLKLNLLDSYLAGTDNKFRNAQFSWVTENGKQERHLDPFEGELKRVVSEKTGIEAEEQKLLFRGKEHLDDKHLDLADETPTASPPPFTVTESDSFSETLNLEPKHDPLPPKATEGEAELPLEPPQPSLIETATSSDVPVVGFLQPKEGEGPTIRKAIPQSLISFREESNVVADLSAPERQALDEFKQLVTEALNTHQFSITKQASSAAAEQNQTPVSAEEVSIWGVPLLKDDRSDVILLKFLRARDFKVKEAFAALRNTIRWRKQFKIDELVEEDLGDDLEKVVFMHGFDREGHPVCCNVFGEFQNKELYQKTFSDEEKRTRFLRWRVQLLERSIRKLDFRPGGAHTIFQVNDLKNSPGPSKSELRLASVAEVNEDDQTAVDGVGGDEVEASVYHGPEGLKTISQRVHGLAGAFAVGVKKLGTAEVQSLPFFDTVKVTVADAHAVADAAVKSGINLRVVDSKTITVAFDETTTLEDVDDLFKIFALGKPVSFTAQSLAPEVESSIPSGLARETPYLTHPIFNSYHTEHELLRYIHKLQSKDLSLCHSMIPLGSCTMKLNATTEMMPVTWPSFTDLHPFAPTEQAEGYQEMFKNLGDLLCTITGFDSFSLQPNAGAAGEYAGLMVIRAYHFARGDHHRNVCIIPVSAHGTNPASAAMCGMKIVTIGTDAKGNINIAELKKAAEANKDNLSALMVTYPSTHGVYEEGIDEICKIIHDNGGQVYMDGANMNAQVGLTSPGWIGADVCHLNLHKTFCIPHGGGGPGMGPIGVKAHLAPYLPSHPVVPTGGIPAPENPQPLGTISAAPWGSALILPISYTYIAMMGSKGLTDASKIAILSANYMAKRLENYYPILFRGVNGTVAHEFIVDLRGFKTTAGIEPEDIAKRLMDYGFHGPTMSWPVPGTLMIEPTESESKAELDRFCDALISIREEIGQIEKGKADIHNNVLKGAPHPPHLLMGDTWSKPYSREYAAFPASWLRSSKFWPTTGRVDNVYGDRNLICTLQPEPVEEAAAATA